MGFDLPCRPRPSGPSTGECPIGRNPVYRGESATGRSISRSSMLGSVEPSSRLNSRCNPATPPERSAPTPANAQAVPGRAGRRHPGGQGWAGVHRCQSGTEGGGSFDAAEKREGANLGRCPASPRTPLNAPRTGHACDAAPSVIAFNEYGHRVFECAVFNFPLVNFDQTAFSK